MNDDRVVCTDCARYDLGDHEARIFGAVAVLAGRCLAAKPPMSRVPDVKHRCEYFNARPGDPDQRKGIERWPELRDEPGGPARKPFPAKERG